MTRKAHHDRNDPRTIDTRQFLTVTSFYLISTKRNGPTSNCIIFLEIKAGNKIMRNLVDIEETFNEHFTNIAQVLTEYIPAVEVNPEFYLKGPLKSFSPQTSSIDV